MKIQNEDKKFREKVVEILKKKKCNSPCPRCSSRDWSIEGFLNQSLQQPMLWAGMVIGSPSIPSVIIICTNCGFMSHHALGSLGLLPKQHHSGENGD